ncbi:MAG: Holliday junction branch migration protein RuvA [Armatimonadota bacterium]
MISYLRGELVAVDEDSVIVDVAGVGYEVQVSAPFAQRLRERGLGAQVKVFTYHCERGGAAGAGTPMLVGFESELERRFFEELLNVPQFGPVGAARAMVLPIATIAKAISLGDEATLRRLPGVGRQRARDMVAKLQDRMAPYLAAGAEAPVRPADALTVEAMAILTQLGMAQAEALERIAAVREATPDIDEVEELVRAVFRRK